MTVIIYTDVVIDKFLRDMVTIRKPSSPGLIAIHLNETLVEENMVNTIVIELKKAENSIRKVVFVGLNRTSQKLMKSSKEIVGVSFVYAFINDYEKVKDLKHQISKSCCPLSMVDFSYIALCKFMAYNQYIG